LQELGAEQPAFPYQPRLLAGAPLLGPGEEPINCREQEEAGTDGDPQRIDFILEGLERTVGRERPGIGIAGDIVHLPASLVAHVGEGLAREMMIDLPFGRIAEKRDRGGSVLATDDLGIDGLDRGFKRRPLLPLVILHGADDEGDHDPGNQKNPGAGAQEAADRLRCRGRQGP
jgi:hypothetical protein